MTLALFVGFSAMLVLASLLVITQRNPITSALYLVVAFCSLAGLYILLHAEFLGMVQIIVYAGAIMVLFLFVIMYMNLGTDPEGGTLHKFRRTLGWLVGAAVVSAGVALVGRSWSPGPVSTQPMALGVGNTQALGQALYTRYLFPFEITSLVLLVAIVGAIVIARGRGPAVVTDEAPAPRDSGLRPGDVLVPDAGARAADAAATRHADAASPGGAA
jgi:NADH-quinone oxidoreductase subunit J